MRIVDMPPDDDEIIRQTASLLVEGFKGRTPSWPNVEAALTEVRDALEPPRISRIALSDDGTVLGWIGAVPEYSGHVWEMHPLVVHPEYQGQGIGRALITDLERLLRERGALTIFLGTDDEDDRTSLSNRDLYPDVLHHLANIKNLRCHPYEFFQKLGFVVVGVVPDANGPGKPDILMAKRVGKGHEDPCLRRSADPKSMIQP